MQTKLSIDIDINVTNHFAVIGVINTRNGCCAGKPYLLTANATEKSKHRPEGINYSCQCACGMWCTNGHGTPGAAIDEYESMTRRSKKERCRRLRNSERLSRFSND